MRRTTRVMASLMCVYAALAWVACQPSAPKAPPVSAAELAERIRGGTAPVILDVRTPAEYAAGHIPGAINIAHDQLAARMLELPAAKSAEIVVHCQAGGRAAKAEAALEQAGYTNVHDLNGHMGGWVQAGLPVETAPRP